MLIHINHNYHLVEVSPWPIIGSISAILLTSGLMIWFHNYNIVLLCIGLIRTILCIYQWWFDVTRESSFQGLHCKKVIVGLRWGIILFIVSEIFFFFSFFWAFFQGSLTVELELGGVWPPVSIEAFNPFKIPLLNTIVLLGSGITLTWSHHSLIEKEYGHCVLRLIITILLGIYFTILQSFEYIEASFNIRDCIYGSTFFVTTGFHGLHVIIGSLFLFFSLLRILKGHLSDEHHAGFEFSIWYWHFVDVVWLFLFVFIYWWAN